MTTPFTIAGNLEEQIRSCKTHREWENAKDNTDNAFIKKRISREEGIYLIKLYLTQLYIVHGASGADFNIEIVARYARERATSLMEDHLSDQLEQIALDE